LTTYNTKKPHEHLNGLTPDEWAFQARSLPNKSHIIALNSLPLQEAEISTPLLQLPQQNVLEHIDLLKTFSQEYRLEPSMKNKDSKEIFDKIIQLHQSYDIDYIPFHP
jgi:hypothetical protein